MLKGVLFRGQILLPILLLTGPAEGQLVREWRAVTTPHFELVSRYDPAVTTPFILDLEWLRATFLANLEIPSGLKQRALVWIPDNPFEYEQLSPSKLSAGYYKGAPWRDIIVLREMFRARRGFLHEYTHLVMRHQGGQWPAWFNEGTAEYYSGAHPATDGVLVGSPDPGRLAMLKKIGWIPISDLTAADSSTNYTTPEAMGRFYAQSWLLVHMLHLSPAYSERFPQFRGLMAKGTPTYEAVRTVYGKSLVQFDEDARRWFRQEHFPTERLKPPLEPAPKPEVRVIQQLEVDLAKAVVAASPQDVRASRSEYSRLSRAAGNKCEHHAAIGDLAAAANLLREASQHYRDAQRCGTAGAGAAQEMIAPGGDEPAAAQPQAGQGRARAGQSQYLEGRNRFFANDYEGALKAFAAAAELPAVEAFQMKRLETMALVNLGRFDEAQRTVEELRSMATTRDMQGAARLVAEDLERERKRAETPQEPPHLALLRKLIRIDGEVVRVDCMETRARFWIRHGNQTTRLLVADPHEVVNGPEPSPPLEFGCGTQQRPITVGYVEKADAGTDTVGEIRYIEFR